MGSSNHLSGKSGLRQKCERYWKWIAFVMGIFFVLLAFVLGSLLLVFAAASAQSDIPSWPAALSPLLIGGVGICCIVLGILIFSVVRLEGKLKPEAYRKNALTLAKLISILMVFIGAASAVLSIVMPK